MRNIHVAGLPFEGRQTVVPRQLLEAADRLSCDTTFIGASCGNFNFNSLFFARRPRVESGVARICSSSSAQSKTEKFENDDEDEDEKSWLRLGLSEDFGLIFLRANGRNSCQNVPP